MTTPEPGDAELAADELTTEPGDEPAPVDPLAAYPALIKAREAREAGVRHDYDWLSLRKRYVEGVKGDDGTWDWPSLDAVAAHHGVPGHPVRKKASQEGWRGQRQQFQAQVESTRRQAKAAALSREATQLDSSALGAAKIGLQLATHRLAEIARQRDVIPLDAGEMLRWSQAIDLFHKIGLRAVGDPEIHRLEISGPNGRPIEIAAELRRDDPARLAGVLGVLQQAGLGDLLAPGGPRALEATVDGEVIDDEDEP